jgi:hypothetical protein
MASNIHTIQSTKAKGKEKAPQAERASSGLQVPFVQSLAKELLKLTDEGVSEVLSDALVAELQKLKIKLATVPEDKKRRKNGKKKVVKQAQEVQKAKDTAFEQAQNFSIKYKNLKKQVSNKVLQNLKGNFNVNVLIPDKLPAEELVEHIKRGLMTVKAGDAHFKITLMSLVDQIFGIRDGFKQLRKTKGEKQIEEKWLEYYADKIQGDTGYSWYVFLV